MNHNVELVFDGKLLKRGFWMYVWKIITVDDQVFYYVGRTGDSSSSNAASPFSRMSTHLSPKAKGNSIYKNLKMYDIDLETSIFKMFAHGPIFEELDNFEDHKIYRDKIAAIEFEVAKMLKEKGKNVIGLHGSNKLLDEHGKELSNMIVSKALVL